MKLVVENASSMIVIMGENIKQVKMSKEAFRSPATMGRARVSVNVRIPFLMPFYTIRFDLFFYLPLLFLYPKKDVIEVFLSHMFREVTKYPGFCECLKWSQPRGRFYL